MCPTYRFGPGLDALVFIILDLAPLIVYLPALIIFNLASGPAQSFLFFYHALSAVVDSDLLIGLSAVGSNRSGLLWGLLIMQSPINNVVSPCTLPYIALQYCKLPAVLVAIVMTVVLVKCIHCPCASWRHPWAKLHRSTRNFREKHAQKGTVLNGMCTIVILTYGFVIQQVFSVLTLSSCCPGGADYCSYYCTELELEYGKDARVPSFPRPHCHSCSLQYCTCSSPASPPVVLPLGLWTCTDAACNKEVPSICDMS